MTKDWRNVVGWQILIIVTLVLAGISHKLLHGGSWVPAAIIAYWLARRWFYGKKVFNKAEVVAPTDSVFHPFPIEYAQPLPEAFGAVRRVLAESVYNVSDKWKDVSADTEEKRITAGMQPKLFTDEKNYLRLEVDFRDTDQGSTIIEFKFDPRTKESFNQLLHGHLGDYASEFVADVGEKLGPGRKLVPMATMKQTYKYDFSKIPAPSWWLLLLTVGGIMQLFNDIFC